MVMLYGLQVVTIGAKTSPLFRTLRKKTVEDFAWPTRNATISPGDGMDNAFQSSDLEIEVQISRILPQNIDAALSRAELRRTRVPLNSKVNNRLKFLHFNEI